MYVLRFLCFHLLTSFTFGEKNLSSYNSSQAYSCETMYMNGKGIKRKETGCLFLRHLGRQ